MSRQTPEAYKAYWEANRDEILIKKRARYYRDVERSRLYHRTWYAAHRDSALASHRKWNAKHPAILVAGELLRINELPPELQPVALLIVETRRELRKRGTTT